VELPIGCSSITIRSFDARRGSGMLKDAILRAKGYRVPEKLPVAPPIIPQAPIIKVRRRGFAKKGFRKVRLPNTQIAQIQAVVAVHFGLTIEEMLQPGRAHRIMIPRQIAMYLSRRTTGVSYPDIGIQFGGKDHSTIIHACRQVERRIAAKHPETIAALRRASKVIGL